MNAPAPAELANHLDVALWNPSATAGEIEALCAEARQLKVRAVCVNGSRVELAYARLEDSEVKAVALVGFPLGTMDADAKRFEAELAVDQGAHEVEIVLNPGLLKDGAHARLLRELRDVVEAADERPVCIALESSLLAREEIAIACQLILDSGAQSVATGTGFWPKVRGSPEEVKLLRELVGPKFGVKAAGDIPDRQTALTLLDAGATRLGIVAGATALRDFVPG